MAVPSMHVLGAVSSTVAGFDPLTIGWHSAYWAEDPAWANPGDGNQVTSWADASGHSRTVTQGTGINRPLYRASVAALNGKPAVDFDGVNDYLASPSAFTATTGDLTKVIVLQMRSTAANQHFFSWGGTGSRTDFFIYADGSWGLYSLGTAVFNGGTPNTSAHLLIGTFATAAKLEIDGATIATGSGTSSLSTHTLGAYAGGSNNANCHIAFAGLYNGVLTAGEKADLLAWSQSHYGTP